MQLTKEQRIIVVNFLDSNSIQHFQELFQERFPERNSPSKVTIWKNVRKYKHSKYTQDGAPAHRTIAVRERLNELFGNRIISLNQRIEWPPRSPDLTPCDFFLWGQLKGKVYNSPPRDIYDLKQRIEQEVNLLRQDNALIRRVMNAMRKRMQLCTERNGWHI
ncbi:hypothetical protein FHG87_019899 [Trinorchestia longiramus]|nr:hypothetical protein FHG87_019899 [Trinorchestia longiramus]